LFEKAAKGGADIIFLDLEDAVAPDDKEQARKNIIQGLNEIDWGTKTMMIRINGLDTHFAYRDVVDVVENCPRLDMILIPKVGVAAGRLRASTCWSRRSSNIRSARRRSASSF
jgi:malyl-CoA/(S)-citramalyl-CoA lyase